MCVTSLPRSSRQVTHKFEDGEHLNTTHWSTGLKTIYRQFFFLGGGGQWPKSSCRALESGARSSGFVPHKHPLLSLSRTLSAPKSTGKYLEEVLAPSQYD